MTRLTWTDRRGDALPLDAVFAAHLGGVKQRIGGTVSRVLQRRARREAVDETEVLFVRTAAGTRVIEGEPIP